MSTSIQNTLLGKLIGEYQDAGMQEYLIREAGYTTQIGQVWPDGQEVNPYAQANAAMYWPKEFIEREREFPLHLREHLVELGKAMGHYMIIGLVEHEPLQLSLEGDDVIRSETMMAFQLIANAERRSDRNQVEKIGTIESSNSVINDRINRYKRMKNIFERLAIVTGIASISGIYLSPDSHTVGGVSIIGVAATALLIFGAGTHNAGANWEAAKLQAIPDDIRDIDEPYEKVVRAYLARLQANSGTA